MHPPIGTCRLRRSKLILPNKYLSFAFDLTVKCIGLNLFTPGAGLVLGTLIDLQRETKLKILFLSAAAANRMCDNAIQEGEETAKGHLNTLSRKLIAKLMQRAFLFDDKQTLFRQNCSRIVSLDLS